MCDQIKNISIRAIKNKSRNFGIEKYNKETNITQRGSATNLSWQEKKISELEDKSIDIIQISKVGEKMKKK